jgi:hypothetical protein
MLFNMGMTSQQAADATLTQFAAEMYGCSPPTVKRSVTKSRSWHFERVAGAREWLGTLGPLGFARRDDKRAGVVLITLLGAAKVDELKRTFKLKKAYYRECPLDKVRTGRTERVWSRYPELPGGQFESARSKH